MSVSLCKAGKGHSETAETKPSVAKSRNWGSRNGFSSSSCYLMALSLSIAWLKSSYTAFQKNTGEMCVFAHTHTHTQPPRRSHTRDSAVGSSWWHRRRHHRCLRARPAELIPAAAQLHARDAAFQQMLLTARSGVALP